eukprot:SM000185S04061  [mRNA]  locus=s185:244999:245208:- [translate_table: standard]
MPPRSPSAGRAAAYTVGSSLLARLRWLAAAALTALALRAAAAALPPADAPPCVGGPSGSWGHRLRSVAS